MVGTQSKQQAVPDVISANLGGGWHNYPIVKFELTSNGLFKMLELFMSFSSSHKSFHVHRIQF